MRQTWKTVPLDTLHEDPGNVRRHGGKNRSAVRASLAEFGQVEVLVVEEGTGRVLGGNCRLAEMRALGMTEARVCEVDLHGPDAVRLALALNRSGELAEWDPQGLRSILAELDDLEGLGWSEDDLAAMEEPKRHADYAEPEIAALHERVHSVDGEVYQLGPHRLVCGDCTKEEVWAALMGGELAGMLLTDPPYGVDYSSKNEMLNAFDKGNRCQTPIENDALSAQDMRTLWTASFRMAAASCRKGATYYTTGPQGGELLLLLLLSIQDAGWLLKHMLIWAKNNHVLGRSDFFYKHEPILYGWLPGAGHYFDPGTDGRTSLWEIDKPNSSKDHPTMKPVPLFERAIGHGSRTSDLVVDPFGGSGTTLIACAQMGRRARLIEISPAYCDLIRRRWTAWAMAHNVEPGLGALEIEEDLHA